MENYVLIAIIAWVYLFGAAVAKTNLHEGSRFEKTTFALLWPIALMLAPLLILFARKHD